MLHPPAQLVLDIYLLGGWGVAGRSGRSGHSASIYGLAVWAGCVISCSCAVRTADATSFLLTGKLLDQIMCLADFG